MASIRVLIVDDEEELAITIAERLEIRGIQAQTTSDGDSALSLIKNNPPDVVVLDMNMPNYDGGYALEKITQDYPDAKVIVVTAFTDYSFEKAKASAILTKPYDFEPFLDTVKNVAKGTFASPFIK